MSASPGGRTLSIQLPRRQAATIPSVVPSAKAIVTLSPCRKTVHIKPEAMTSETGWGKYAMEMPWSPLSVLEW